MLISGRIIYVAKPKFSPRAVRERRAALRKKALRVLVVENHSDTREGIQRFLKTLGYHATATASMTAALTSTETETFDLLLSDISLPDGDGWKLLESLRAQGREPRHSGAMSGLSGPVERARSREAGYKAHLIKPFSPQDLEKVLHQAADELAPLMIASAPALQRHERWRQRMHDGLCQQLAASSLLQAALVNRLETLVQSSETPAGRLARENPPDDLKSTLAALTDEARRIGELVHEALGETRAIMREMEA